MGMEMRRAGRHGILQFHVTLEPLMQIPGLRNVEGSPTAILGLFGIDVNPRQRSESSIKGMDLELILLTGLPGPKAAGGRCSIRIRVTTE
jgi:hypothetical protein